LRPLDPISIFRRLFLSGASLCQFVAQGTFTQKAPVPVVFLKFFSSTSTLILLFHSMLLCFRTSGCLPISTVTRTSSYALYSHNPLFRHWYLPGPTKASPPPGDEAGCQFRRAAVPFDESRDVNIKKTDFNMPCGLSLHGWRNPHIHTSFLFQILKRDLSFEVLFAEVTLIALEPGVLHSPRPLKAFFFLFLSSPSLVCTFAPAFDQAFQRWAHYSLPRNKIKRTAGSSGSLSPLIRI